VGFAGTVLMGVAYSYASIREYVSGAVLHLEDGTTPIHAEDGTTELMTE
jgi:hypothetical protein